MDYCGIDLAGVSSYMYVMDEKGKKLASGEVATDKVAFARRLKRFVRGGLSIATKSGDLDSTTRYFYNGRRNVETRLGTQASLQSKPEPSG